MTGGLLGKKIIVLTSGASILIMGKSAPQVPIFNGWGGKDLVCVLPKLLICKITLNL